MDELNDGEIKTLIYNANRGYSDEALKVTQYYIDQLKAGNAITNTELLAFIAKVLQKTVDNVRASSVLTEGRSIKDSYELHKRINIMDTFGASASEISEHLSVVDKMDMSESAVKKIIDRHGWRIK